MLGLQQTDLMGNLFHSGTSQFYYDISKPYTQLFRDVFWYVTIVMPLICLAIYIAIIITAIMVENLKNKINFGTI